MPEIARPSVRIVAFGEDRDGELYFLDYDGGTLHTIERNDAGARNADFPTKLSQTGLFASVKDQTPAAGVIPFAVNSRQWQDGATAEHWVAFPGESSATLYATGKPIPGMVDWHNFRMHFPKDAVLVRTLSLGGRRLETQLLHFDGVDWRAYTFAWRDDQADADLVPAEGAEKEVRDGEAEARVAVPEPQPVHVVPQQLVGIRAGVPARAVEPAGARRAQPARRPHGGGTHPPGRRRWQAAAAVRRRLGRAANASSPTRPTRASRWRRGPAPTCTPTAGTAIPTAAAGRSTLRLQFPVAGRRDEGGRRPPHPRRLRAAGGVHHQAGRPVREHPVLPHGQVRPRSDAAHRLRTAGRSGPEADRATGSRAWTGARQSRTAARTAGRRTRCWPTRGPRCCVARKLGRGELKPAERDALLAAAAKLPTGPIRDLFEGYLPSDEKGARGSSARTPGPGPFWPSSGDAGRGERLFWSQAVNCGSCHKIGDRGTPVGPDLSTIGKLRSREDLLESILEPSRRIEPKYAAYVAHTADGRSFTGLLVRRDEKEVVLRDGQNKEIILAAKDVEELQPSRTSLMPDGQLAGLTAQEAADLLEYLATRKGEK